MKYTITDLDASEVALIFDLLGEVPLKRSGPIFTKIRDQIEEQNADQRADADGDEYPIHPI